MIGCHNKWAGKWDIVLSIDPTAKEFLETEIAEEGGCQIVGVHVFPRERKKAEMSKERTVLVELIGLEPTTLLSGMVCFYEKMMIFPLTELF
jgi:hypothetical protein